MGISGPGCIEPNAPAFAPGSQFCPVDDLSPSAPGVYNGWDYAQCVAPGGPEDIDFDGVDDTCERNLAADFAPKLLVHATECTGWMWDNANSRLGGEYYYLVARRQPQIDTVINVIYLMAYYKDCGSTRMNLAEHIGDSEFIGVEVVFDVTTNHWVTSQVFLSAHCGGGPILNHPSDYYCRWYPASSMYYDRYLAAPNIMVSADKHANYPNYDACFNAYGGSWLIRYEDCDQSSYPLRFPISLIQRNIGSRAYPNPWSTPTCPYPVGTQANPSLTECLWDSGNRSFKGWLTDAGGEGAYGYGRHLQTYFLY